MSGNAKLTLIVDGTLSVYGGAATQPPTQTAKLAGTAGVGGHPGIAVPNGSMLTVRGSGRLSAYGGHASNGSAGTSGITGGAGGAGAGAGIGGVGGAGGLGGWESATNGGNGTSAGAVQVYEKVQVYAYGGAGGSGNNAGGGFPAAGIGGGGAGAGGGYHPISGAGFSSKGADSESAAGEDGNGRTSPKIDSATGWHRYPGGAYFNGVISPAQNNISLIGGLYAVSWTGSSFATATDTATSGNSGQGGAGGEVRKVNTAALYTYNGNYKTTTKTWGDSPTPIYAQSGYDLDLLRKAGVTKVEARTKSALESELGSKGKSSSITPTGLPGVGSGAGFTESATEYVRDGSYLVGQVMILDVISNFLLWRIPRFTTECVGDYVYFSG